MTGHSNAGMTRITKLDRIGKRAKAQPDTVFNNIGHAISEELMRAAYEQLEQRKAVGIDKVDKATYGKALKENISILIKKIRRKQYRHQASRIVEIPKEDGSTRPLAISCFEDKLVEWTVSKILGSVASVLFVGRNNVRYSFKRRSEC